MYTLHHDMNMDIASWWSARFKLMSTPLMLQSKSVGDSLVGVAFVEALATSRKPHDLSSRWRTWTNALDFMLLDMMKMELEFKLEVEAMPVESAVLRLEDWVYNVAEL